MAIKNCECGSKKFIVDEGYVWNADLNEDGELDCGHSDGGINEICCAECGKKYGEEDFNQINF